MAIWERFFKSNKAKQEPQQVETESPTTQLSRFAVFDVEVGVDDRRIHDIGAVRDDGAVFHQASLPQLFSFINDVHFLCGHNIVRHDTSFVFANHPCRWVLVDTLFMSPLLFPERPYHRLVKDDKLVTEQLNNPVNDSKKAMELLQEELAAWHSLPITRQQIFTQLLRGHSEFDGFLQMAAADNATVDVTTLIKETYHGKICENVDIATIVREQPCELAYALALIDVNDNQSLTPRWVLHNYPNVEYVMRRLRHIRCSQGCNYCNLSLDVHLNLKKFFGYDQFRTYEGEPLQEQAAQAAVDGKSLLAIFPTGGGKSLTFQLPALMEGHSVHGLTVVISPLQSLMKDQVDSLSDRGIVDAVTINGLLDPISRSLMIQRVLDGNASLLYIAPEMLRSKTIEHILEVRHVVRFVIDEAHCFSSWGQDFRVDYLYIGTFIRNYQQRKKVATPIPVSCFTATAKPKVVQDITDYFKRTLDINLELFASSATRTNLRYQVIHVDGDEEKYYHLRSLVESYDCPTIIYVSRVKRTEELAIKLTRDGYKALPYNGKMDTDEKINNQEDFMTDQVRIIVATSAFGMGVDKKDVGLVVHYDISDSLENYVQEAGRAGRDPQLQARCFVLYSDGDLDKHFILLNQTKLSISEIQQVWKAIKYFTRINKRVCCSPLEIARQAGWDDTVRDIETRVRTAISALEQSGHLTRGNNVPHVYATGLTVKNMDEARKRITESLLFDTKEMETAVRIVKSFISSKHRIKEDAEMAEARVDYIADILGLTKEEVISAVERMRQEGIIADTKDITAYIQDNETEKRSRQLLERFAKLERFILEQIPDDALRISSRVLNDNAVNSGISTSKEKDIRTLLYFLTIKSYTRKREDAAHNIELLRIQDMTTTLNRFHHRIAICRYVVEWLYQYAAKMTAQQRAEHNVQFSVVELLNDVKANVTSLMLSSVDIQLEDVEEALLYLSKIGALKLEGGFLVIYNAMDISRIKDAKFNYKKDDYAMLDEFYRQKIQQIHIVGEYANLMVKDYDAALLYVQHYFQMDYKKFIAKYFSGERTSDIQRNISPQKFDQLFKTLSPKQMEIISDKETHTIVVAAGPGSGKTKVLVHKLASLLMMEDVKHEQLLMLTFSRSAATEFKQRLMQLIGNAAHFVEIKTFHSYCFDLLGRIGNLEDAQNVVAQAAEMIRQGEVEQNRIGKTVLVIDEAQDMSEDDFALVSALMHNNEDMRVIAVGDDDQNIYQFRGSDSRYMAQLLESPNSKLIEMNDNYRSSHNVVEFANAFVCKIKGRLKTSPMVSMNPQKGRVCVTYHTSKEMFLPVVEQLVRNRGEGSTAILTKTNEEAVILVALLRKHGINSKLIQSIDGFRFANLAEVRYFLKYISKRVNETFIPSELWNEAKQILHDKYNGSSVLQYVDCCLEVFEQTNKNLYITDFKEFVYESSVEDFYKLEKTDIVVSTIHKAKGREFDDVYMMINGNSSTEDANRCYFVAITRAKQRLFIHTNGSLFKGLNGCDYVEDTNQYAMPSEVVLQLSHRDVWLGFFANIKSEILALRGGDTLVYKDFGFIDPRTQKVVCRLSKQMQKVIGEWQQRGYEITAAKVRFVVAWRSKEAPKDEAPVAVLLPDIVMTKS